MAKKKEEDAPRILTQVRFDQPNSVVGAQADTFEPGEEEEFENYLDDTFGDGDEDADPPVPSKDQVLERLQRKGHIAGFLDGVEPDHDDSANGIDIDQRNSLRERRRVEDGGEPGLDEIPTARRSTTGRTPKAKPAGKPAAKRSRQAKQEEESEE